MSPASVNDCIRENMAAVAKQYLDQKGTVTTGGTTTAYTVTTNNVFTALTDISLFAFQVNAANTGAATLAVDGLTAKAMQLNGAALAAGDIRTNEIVLAVYNPDNDVFDIFKSGLNQDVIKTDTINEQTAASGVTVDSVLLKDGGITLATGPAVNAVLDEDTMASDSATSLATQQSVKAYVDNTVISIGALSTSGTQVANDFARFVTAGQLEGRSYAEVRADLSLEPGTNVQAYDAGLDSIAGLTTAADKMIYTTALDTYAVTDLSSFARTILDDTTASAVRTTIGVDAAGVDNSSVTRDTRISNTILGASDKGVYVDITANTFTQTFTAAATLGSGWFCYLGNSGTGDITLDPNGIETIDGLTSFVMYPGEVRLIQCDGSNFNSIVLQSFRKSFLSSGTFTKPPGYKTFRGLLWSGGASGGRTNGVNNGQGGAGGGCIPFDIEESFIGSTEIVTIGAGGAAFTGVSDTGNVGSDSSFGTLVYCYAGDTTGVPGAGVLNGSDTTFIDSTGNGYAGSSTGYQIWGGGTAETNAIYGGAGGGQYPFGGPATVGGTSKFGGDGGDGGSTGNGQNGAQPAGGGGGTNTGTQSGAGGDGQLDIWGVQ